MAAGPLARALAAVLLVGTLAGCASLVSPGPATPTLTPAPVPDAPATPTATVTPGDPGPAGAPPVIRPEGWTSRQPRYDSMRPTCDRPPGLVIHIQVAALQTNDPATNAGINTTWQFAAPSNRESVGPYRNFVRLITTRYQPLLDAETVRYGPLRVDGTVAVRNVTVRANGTTTPYRWEVERQTRGRFEGCWMTTSVFEIRGT